MDNSNNFINAVNSRDLSTISNLISNDITIPKLDHDGNTLFTLVFRTKNLEFIKEFIKLVPPSGDDILLSFTLHKTDVNLMNFLFDYKYASNDKIFIKFCSFCINTPTIYNLIFEKNEKLNIENIKQLSLSDFHPDFIPKCILHTEKSALPTLCENIIKCNFDEHNVRLIETFKTSNILDIEDINLILTSVKKHTFFNIPNKPYIQKNAINLLNLLNKFKLHYSLHDSLYEEKIIKKKNKI